MTGVGCAGDDLAWTLKRFGSAPGVPVRLAFVDAADSRVQKAVTVLARSGLVEPVVIDAPQRVTWPSGVELVSLDDSVWSGRVIEAWAHCHQGRPDRAAEQLNALTFMAVAVRLGLAEAGIAGSMSTSASVIRAGLRGLGVDADVGLVAGAFVVGTGEALWTWADCSVIPVPDADQLAIIAGAAADLHRRVSGEAPRVAMLSFSTAGSADHPAVIKVRAALARLRQNRPGLEVDGEMQFDAAVDPAVGSRKFPRSTVAGRANVFIFPELDSGNIAYKVVQRVGQARIMGSFVLGLARPWIDLSRGCDAAEIVRTALALRSISLARPMKKV